IPFGSMLCFGRYCHGSRIAPRRVLCESGLGRKSEIAVAEAVVSLLNSARAKVRCGCAGCESSFPILHLRREFECPLYHFQECSLFAQDELPGLSHSEVVERFCVRSESRTIAFVRSEAVERD